MKIVFITSSSINGGAQKHIREMFHSLRRLGNEVYLIAPKGWLINELKGDKDKIILMDSNIKNIFRLRAVLDMICPDIVNTFILSGGVFGVVAWKKKQYGKIFVTVNNPVLYDGITTVRKIFYPRLYRWMSRYVTAFLVKSENVRNEVDEVIKKRKPVISIKNGIDFKVFDKNRKYPDIRSEFGIEPEDIVITNVAALEVRKGQEYLIKAVEELRKKYPIHLLLIGEGSMEGELRNLVAKKKAKGYIHFLGYRRDINCILANSDIFVLPSIHEGLPNALMEAMAMGLPCIATDVGGVRQLIDDGNQGIIIGVKSHIEIKLGIEKVITQNDLSIQIRENAFKKIKNGYSQDSTVQDLITLYGSASMENEYDKYKTRL